VSGAAAVAAKTPFSKYALPNTIRSLRPLLADLWDTRRERPNPMLPVWKLGSLNHSELLILELVGLHEDYDILEKIHNGLVKEEMTRDGSSLSEQSAGWHSEATYAYESGLSLRQVSTILKALEEKKYIKIWPRGPRETTRKRVNRAKLAQLLTLNGERIKRNQKTNANMAAKGTADASAEDQQFLDEQEKRYLASLQTEDTDPEETEISKLNTDDSQLD